MARDVDDPAPLDTRDALVGWFEEGSKPRDRFRVGTEHEKFVFYRNDLSPVPYLGRAGQNGIRALLDELALQTGWDSILEGDDIIGLADPVAGGAISLEPAGQFELSGAPLSTIHETRAELDDHLTQAHTVANRNGMGFLGLGMSPLWTLAQTPIMPKGRYRIMANYMPRVGTRGLDMMFRTATVQANLDFSSEADMVRKLRVSLALQPVATALWANSPFTEGRPNGFLSARSEIWRHTDNARSGMMAFAFEPGMGFERYVDYALDVPMYFIKRGDGYRDVAGESFRDLMDGKLKHMPGERPTLSDWANHLSTIFPEVRLKRYLEMRGSDMGSAEAACGLPALFVGLLYDDIALDGAWELVKHWSDEDRQRFRDEVPRLGFKAVVAGRPVLDVARDVVTLARGGLERRRMMDPAGADETVYLNGLEEMLDRGQTKADSLLEKYEGAWAGNAAAVFTECAL